MDRNELTRLETIFHALLEVPRGAERDAAALRLSEGNGELARRALELVQSDEKAEAANQAATAANREAASAPRLYGHYRTVRLVGSGGMGAVYLAERADGQFQQTVAVKVIAPHVAGQAFRERFLAERQILAALNHPNITKLLDGGVTGEGTPYLVMEYVDGQPLDRYCDQHQLGLRERLQLFLKMCAAVGYAHRNLVVHRDLKPSNILVTPEGRPMLLDFGTAKLLAAAETNTNTILPLLTFRYSSPEQRSGASITTSTDIFSLGVILYELLTGAWPFGDPSSTQQILERFARETPMTAPRTAATENASLMRSTNLRSLRSLLAGDLSNILAKALAPAPEQRYESVQALAADIENWLGGLPVAARPPSFSYRARKFLYRHWLVSSAAAVFILGLLGSTLFSVHQASVARAEAMKARTVTRFLADLLETQNPLVNSSKMTLVEVIDRARQSLDQFDNQPSVQAELHLRLGSAYANMYFWDKAEGEFRKAVESGRRARDSEKVAVAESELGASLVLTGRNRAESEALCRDALSRIRAIKAPDPLSAYLVLGNHALVNWQLNGHSRLVESLAKEAIAVAKKDPSVPGWRPATGEIDLAVYFTQEGRFAEAETLLKDALEMELHGGRTGIVMATILSSLGTLRAQAGDLAEAERYQRKSVEELIRSVGPENGRVAWARALWAISLARLKRNGEAVEECHQALELERKSEPPESPRLPVVLGGCAFVLNAAGMAGEAERDAREALVLKGSPATAAQATTELGVALAAQQRYEEAIPLLAKGEQFYLGNPGFGAKHYSTVRAHEALVAARASAGH